MITGTTRSGFAFEVDEGIGDDMELFEAICDLDDGKMTAVVPVTRKILGDQKQALYDFLRDEKGRVPVNKVSEAVIDIFSAVKNGKKS